MQACARRCGGERGLRTSYIDANPWRKEKLQGEVANCPEGTQMRRAKPPALGPLASAQPHLRGLGQGLPLASRTRRVEAPNILRFVVPQYKKIAVLRPDAKIDRLGGIPLVFHFRDFEGAPAQDESCGALVGSITGVALDAHFAHRCLPRPKVYKLSLLQSRDEVSSRNSAIPRCTPRRSGGSSVNCIQIRRPIVTARPP